MTPRSTLRALSRGALLVGLFGRAPALRADSPAPDPALAQLGGKVAAQLGALARKQMYLVTDKPLYHPGETVWFRAWELSVRGLAEAPGEHGVTFALLDPRGTKVAERRVLYQNGTASNDIALPADLAGGPYTLKATSDLGASRERALSVSAYELPRLKKTLDFARSSYGPSDAVVAFFKMERATGEPAASAPVTAVVTLDGAELARFVLAADAKGAGTVRFQLPAQIRRGDALLTLTVDAGGVAESMQRRVPILLDTLELAAFPEGGDLVFGLPARVYVSGRDTLGKPAEFEADLVDDRGLHAAHVRTLHGGMGRLSFTPEAGRSYALRTTRPGKGGQTLALPAPHARGCTLQSDDDYRSQRPEIRVHVRCTEQGRVMATAVLREQLVASRAGEVTEAGGKTTLALPIPPGSQGAVRVTLFDEKDTPLAERLVYRGLGAGLRVSVTPDRASYGPRDRVTLTVRTTDEAGKPAPADLALSVVDDALLSFADDRSGHILASLYLEPEMPGQRLADPNFYFSPDPKAPEALDLLLGTQGYRRFAWAWVK